MTYADRKLNQVLRHLYKIASGKKYGSNINFGTFHYIYKLLKSPIA